MLKSGKVDRSCAGVKVRAAYSAVPNPASQWVKQGGRQLLPDRQVFNEVAMPIIISE